MQVKFSEELIQQQVVKLRVLPQNTETGRGDARYSPNGSSRSQSKGLRSSAVARYINRTGGFFRWLMELSRSLFVATMRTECLLKIQLFHNIVRISHVGDGCIQFLPDFQVEKFGILLVG